MPSARLAKFTVHFHTSQEFHLLKREIFTQNIYYFETEKPRPVILDVGAHIGLSTLYFKQLYPGARVTAIEPNPTSYELLMENISENGLADVEAVQVAVAAAAGSRHLSLDQTPTQWFSTASFSPGAWNGEQSTIMITVPTVPLADFLHEPIDFMKLDVEGAEQETLLAAGPLLSQIQEMIIEFHPVAHQKLTTVTKLLRDLHFELSFWKNGHQLIEKKARGLVLIHATNTRPSQYQ